MVLVVLVVQSVLVVHLTLAHLQGLECLGVLLDQTSLAGLGVPLGLFFLLVPGFLLPPLLLSFLASLLFLLLLCDPSFLEVLGDPAPQKLLGVLLCQVLHCLL